MRAALTKSFNSLVSRFQQERTSSSLCLAATFISKVVEPLKAIKPPRGNALYTAAAAYFGLGDRTLKKVATSAASSSGRKARSEACLWYGKSVDAWHQIEHPSHSTPKGFDAGDPAAATMKLQ